MDAGRHPLIEVVTNAEITGCEGSAGRLHRHGAEEPALCQRRVRRLRSLRRSLPAGRRQRVRHGPQGAQGDLPPVPAVGSRHLCHRLLGLPQLHAPPRSAAEKPAREDGQIQAEDRPELSTQHPRLRPLQRRLRCRRHRLRPTARGSRAWMWDRSWLPWASRSSTPAPSAPTATAVCPTSSRASSSNACSTLRGSPAATSCARRISRPRNASSSSSASAPAARAAGPTAAGSAA